MIDGILTTNLIYQTPELLERPYYINCDMSKYIALMIDTLNRQFLSAVSYRQMSVSRTS